MSVIVVADIKATAYTPKMARLKGAEGIAIAYAQLAGDASGGTAIITHNIPEAFARKHLVRLLHASPLSVGVVVDVTMELTANPKGIRGTGIPGYSKLGSAVMLPVPAGSAVAEGRDLEYFKTSWIESDDALGLIMTVNNNVGMTVALTTVWEWISRFTPLPVYL